MATNRELEEAEQVWDKMDDTGYAGKLGSNKPEATRLVQVAHQKLHPGEQLSNSEPSQGVQPPLLSMSPAEQRQADIIATNKKLQPNGKYRRPKSKGVRSPIDYSAGERGINKEVWRRPR